MKHTPGPWKIGTHDRVINYLPIYARIGPTRIACIAKTDGHEVGFGIAQSEMEANAHLIAAAPDLAEIGSLLLRTVWDTLRHGLTDGQRESLEEVGKEFAQVLARAEGRE